MQKSTRLKRCPLNIIANDSHHYTHSQVVLITGPKRSGKSLLLARLLYRDMLRHRKVWSSMPVWTPKAYLDKGFPMQRTMDIDWDGFYLLSEAYQEGTIGLDEGINWDDSRASLTTRNKLMNTVMNQVGHRNLNVYVTVKHGGWLDRRLIFECDIEIKCFDLALSPWGRGKGLTRGERIRLEWYDRSGAITGKASDIKDGGSPFRTTIWGNASAYWTAYDTKEIVGVEELYTPVRLDLRTRRVTNKVEFDEPTLEAMHKIATGLRDYNNNAPVKAEDYWSAVRGAGIEGDTRQLGRYLKRLGAVKRHVSEGYFYDFSKLLEKAS